MNYIPTSSVDIWGVKNRLRVEKKYQVMMLMLDISSLVIAYFVAPLALKIAFQNEGLFSFESGSTHTVAYVALACAFLFFLFCHGYYRARLPWWSQIRSIVKGTIICLLAHSFFQSLIQVDSAIFTIVMMWCMAAGFLILGRLILNRFKLRSRSWKLPTVLFADKDTVINTLFALCSDPAMGLDAKTVLLRDKDFKEVDREDFPLSKRGIEIVNGLKGYDDYIQSNRGSFYIISLETLRGKRRDELVILLRRLDIQFAIIPSISHLSLYNSDPLYFFGNDVMILRVYNRVQSILGKFLKRSIDLLGAVTAGIIFLIPMLVTAYCLKHEGAKGSIFYCGERVGRGGKPFRCWKFRTMDPGSEYLLYDYLDENPDAKLYWEKYFKLPDDPRVRTRTARIIRKLSIDELPQLWNVIRGDMSLVGPRPILFDEVEAYGARISEYYMVRPGVTGLWQASGRSNTSFERRVLWDTWYVRNWSLWGDIVIIFKTLKSVIRGAGAS